MGFLAQFLETRSVDLTAPPRWFTDFLGHQTATGVSVTPDTAMRSTAVFACVRVLSESEASLPLITYERLPAGGKRRAVNHALYQLLHDLPNPEMTAIEFREVLTGHAALRGNGLAEIEFNSAGAVKALWPLRPDKVERLERLSGGKLVYVYRMPDNTLVGLPAERVFHVKGPSSDGLWGYSPIRVAMEAVGLALATEEFGARFFGNGARPGVVLEHPGKLSQAAYERLKESYTTEHEGLSNAHRAKILEEGMKIHEIGVAPDEAQFLETRKFQVREIARLYRMQPHMIQDLEQATFSNIEHQGIEFVTHTLRPWLVRWEQAIYRNLMTPMERTNFFAEHLVDGLLRGDIQSRYQAYAIGRQNGWFNADDIRELENMNPLPEGQGQTYLVPLNMVPADQVSAVRGLRAAGDPETRAADETRARIKNLMQSRNRLGGTYRRLIDEAAARVVKRETADVARAARKHLGKGGADDFTTWLTDFYRDHQEFFIRQFLPVLMSYAEQVGLLVGAELSKDPDGGDIETYVRDYVRQLARQHGDISLAMLENTLHRAADEAIEPVQAIDDELAVWEAGRAQKIAQRESVGFGNALAIALYGLAGVQRLYWASSGGETCPYCKRLDGKTVGINRPFLPAGASLEGNEGDAPLVPINDVMHAPAHQGCDCVILAR